MTANEAVRSLASDRVRVIDLDAFFLDASGMIRRWDSGGHDLYIDPTHVSSVGARLVAQELRAAMDGAMRNPSP